MKTEIKKTVIKLGILAFIAMSVTGFLPLLFGKKVLSGWWMISHVTIAPIFSILAAVGALLWVKSAGVGLNDISIIVWIFLILFIPNALSVLFSMNTWFPSSTQYLLLQTHYYTAIVMFFLALIHIGLSRKNKE